MDWWKEGACHCSGKCIGSDGSRLCGSSATLLPPFALPPVAPISQRSLPSRHPAPCSALFGTSMAEPQS
eukprot:364185-Chlamydomonas_euryale.AAC.4